MVVEDHYEVLGIPQDAAHEDIRTAWRKAALMYHPDSVDNPGGNPERFREATAAWKELGNPEKRRLYDLSRRKETRTKPTGQSYSHTREAREHGKPRREDHSHRALIAEAWVALDAAYAGVGVASVGVETLEVCPVCAGMGEHAANVCCPTCAGHGSPAWSKNELACPRCRGSGRVYESRACTACAGMGSKLAKETIRMRVPPGIADHGVVSTRLPSGRQVDITIRIGATKPWKWHRGRLCITRKFSACRLAKGSTCTVGLPDGTRIKIRIPAGCEAGTFLRLKGRGMLGRNGTRDDALVHVESSIS